MQIKIQSQNLSLSSEQKEFIETKVQKLVHLTDRLSDDSSEVKVNFDFGHSHNPEEAYKCIINFVVPRDLFHAEAKADSLDSALEAAIHKVRPQIEQYKDKMHHISDRQK